jgi:arsenate reductase
MLHILILCTGNSCRSQIAHGYLAHFISAEKATIYSAGIETHGVNPRAIATMYADGVDISGYSSNNVDEYLHLNFDYVITVCDNANERCPIFTTKNADFITKKLHYNFPDPAKAVGSEAEINAEFGMVREHIKAYCAGFAGALSLEM